MHAGTCIKENERVDEWKGRKRNRLRTERKRLEFELVGGERQARKGDDAADTE